MKKTVIAAAVLMLAALSARAQEVSYALPRTTIAVEVAYTQDIIHAGKYAKYAKELLGLEVAQNDTVVTEIIQLKLRPKVEADQSRRYSFNLTSNKLPDILALTDQGLVSGNDVEIKDRGGRQIGYRKPEAKPKAEPKVKQTFYEEQIVPGVDSLGNEIMDTILVEIIPVDSLLLKAKEAAEDIEDFRAQRYKILTGDTDASYGGEALGTALAELSRMENDLLALFQPAVETIKGRAFFDVIPDTEGTFPIFALDPARGPVKPGKGETFDLVIKAEPVAEAAPAAPTKKQPSQKLVYRIPAICTVTITDGTDEIMSVRMPVYQLGAEASYPLFD